MTESDIAGQSTVETRQAAFEAALSAESYDPTAITDSLRGIFDWTNPETSIVESATQMIGFTDRAMRVALAHMDIPSTQQFLTLKDQYQAMTDQLAASPTNFAKQGPLTATK